MKCFIKWFVLNALIVIGLISCERTPEITKLEGQGIGTYYAVTVADAHSISSMQIDSVIATLNQELSIFDTNSTLSKINSNETDLLTPLLEEIITLSIDLSEQTDGAFDCTVGALVNLWGFGNGEKEEITEEQIIEALSTVGYEKIMIENHRLVKENPNTQLNFNAIAKGLCVEMVADFLRSKNIENFIVDIGGEMVVSGEKAAETPWRIGVQKPTETATGEIAAEHVLEITNKAVATSGNYRNYIEENGKRYGHTINPKTGMPEKTSLLSATVIADNCTEADALATAFMVMGATKARAFQKMNPKIEIYLIEDK